ncbi:LCP family glycopolymer transferase [Paenibacillus sp. IHBB 10380]|uniref:LCP family glycopolymer transferase n=1 Tax=Paenibacillus sp. IHBB 10380 TaxID=1566358 RepID=UPI0005CFBE77|nr:LCP family protein [Paenibacillus sp. IHBB 10380]AJS60031.1 membrane protein [Paenibacillus sp. IHBB 10380]
MKRWIKITLLALSLFIFIIVGYGIYLYESVKSTANAIYEPREPTKPVTISTDPLDLKGGGPVRMDEREPYTVLVMGVDQRKNDVGRSDTMIVLSVNPSKESILMFNIPRDTRTEIIGHGTTDKINHAYAFGGINMAIQTVENFLNVPINYYIKVNMEGLSQIVDLLGGVKVENPFSFQYEGHDFAQGQLDLNGAEALAYSRMRYDDPRGDFGRNARQREILKQTMKNALQMSNIVHVQSMLDEVGNNVKTDITFDEMKKFITDYRSDLNKIETLELNGQGKRINGIYYYTIGGTEKERVHNLIEDHLQMAIK